MKEQQILDTALTILANTTQAKIKVENDGVKNPEGYYFDAVANLTVAGEVVPLVIEVKARPTQAAVMQVKHWKTDRPVLLVADYINPVLAEQLKEQEIWFLDTAGNAYINHFPLFIWVKGNKLTEKLSAPATNRAFQPSGLKVIYAFLCQPELINASYRDIAKNAEVALGAVGWIINDLVSLGFLVDMGKRRRRLKNKRQLLERWIAGYPEKLRPKQMIGRYKATTNDWWQTTSLQPLQAYWGGEVAADKLTHYLKPEIITLYLPESQLASFLLSHKLRKDPNGNIEILKPFWQFDFEDNHSQFVHPLLIYADLMASADSRNIEAANLIYEKYLAEHFSQD